MYVLQDDAFNYLHHARAYLISHAMGPPNIKALMLLFLEEKGSFCFKELIIVLVFTIMLISVILYPQ